MQPEKRLIDANDALERLIKAEKAMTTVTIVGYKAVPMDGVIDFIASRPTVDAVEVVHGYWIEGMDGSVMCSKCEQVIRYEIGYYCPNCGAKMDDDENG